VPGFIDALRAVADPQEALVFLCRSGKRSDAAATATAAAGFSCVLNVIGGFAGDLDESGQRGKLGGWPTLSSGQRCDANAGNAT
jgi:rhodanese-related sulfurtransferase